MQVRAHREHAEAGLSGTPVVRRRMASTVLSGHPGHASSDDRLPAQVSRVEEVADRLRRRILEEGLPAGARLGTKDDLARHYGVSLGTLNSALRILAVQKIAESRPGVGGGVFVAPSRPHLQLASVLLALREDSDLTLLTNVYTARTQLDVLLARLAAENRTDDDVHVLRAALEAMAIHPGELRWTWDLHDCIAQAAHSPILLAVYRRLAGMVQREVAEITGPGANPQDVATASAHLKRHCELVESIIDGEKERTTALAEEHARRLRHDD